MISTTLPTTDMLRVAFGTEFNRGKLADLVSLLSGRNFETRTFEEDIAASSFERLRAGVMKFMNETNFKRFLMIVRSAGFIEPKMIRSSNAINFAYLVYLTLKSKGTDPALIESYVRRWLALTILTGRAVGSFESQFDYDLKRMEEQDFGTYLQSIENAVLTDGFWEVALPEQHLESAIRTSPYFQVYLASQVKARDHGFLSKDITVSDLILHRGDIHHIFPRAYLKKAGLRRGLYNQIANFVYMQQEINIQIGARPPMEYFLAIRQQAERGNIGYGAIASEEDLSENLRQNCIPSAIFEMTIDDYPEFLQRRRKLMAEKIRAWYHTL
jgi:hypothetical protein